jgi:hypothetical protein
LSRLWRYSWEQKWEKEMSGNVWTRDLWSPEKIWFKVAEAEIRHRDTSRDIQAWVTYTGQPKSLYHDTFWIQIFWSKFFPQKLVSTKNIFDKEHFRRKIFSIKNSCDFSHARAKPETNLNKYSKMYTNVTAKSDVDF